MRPIKDIGPHQQGAQAFGEDTMNDSLSTDSDLEWVSDLLAAQPAPPAPDDVVGRILQALGDEQSSRDPVARPTDSLGELLRGPGAFGPAAPDRFTKKDLHQRGSQTRG